MKSLAVILIFFLSFVHSDYIVVDTNTPPNIYNITDKGIVTNLQTLNSIGHITTAAFFPPSTVYFFGDHFTTYNITSGESNGFLFNSQGLESICISQETGIIYAFNYTSSNDGSSKNISLIAISPSDSTTTFIATVPITQISSKTFQSCIVDDAKGVIYWLNYYAGSSQEICNLWMLDLNTHSARMLVVVANNEQLFAYLGGDGELYLVEVNYLLTQYLVRIPASGMASLQQLAINIRVPSGVDVTKGVNNPSANAVTYFGKQIVYVWPFSQYDTMKNFSLMTAIDVSAAVWVPSV